MLHWEESECARGFPIWLRYLDCGHWGLILTGSYSRWLYPLYPTPSLRDLIVVTS